MIKHFKWEVYTVLACDLVSPLLYRLGIAESVLNANMTTVKSFLDLCLTGKSVSFKQTEVDNTFRKPFPTVLKTNSYHCMYIICPATGRRWLT